jgi:hypothetical protein
MDLHDAGRFLGAMLIPVFWLVVLGLAKWAVRRWKPEWEATLWSPIGSLLWRRRSRANRRRE